MKGKKKSICLLVISFIILNFTSIYSKDLSNITNSDLDKIDRGFIVGYDTKENKFTKLDISDRLDVLNKIKLPVDEKYFNIYSRFGFRTDPIKSLDEDGNTNIRIHRGIDFSKAGINNSNIYSVSDGKIKTVGYNHYSYGNYLVIEHQGFDSLYAHLSSFKEGVYEGKEVVEGDHIGYVGSTGRSTGPHLHLEISIDSILINPALFLNKQDKPEASQIELEEKNILQSKENTKENKFAVSSTGIVNINIDINKEGNKKDIDNNTYEDLNWMPIE